MPTPIEVLAAVCRKLTDQLSDGRLKVEATLARTVLVVDDEPLVLEVTASMLEELGCEVMTAANAMDALTLLRANQAIEMLLTDINMPGMNGYELAQRAQKEKKGLKVVMLSGHAMDDHGLPFVRKPFLQGDLLRAIANSDWIQPIAFD